MNIFTGSPDFFTPSEQEILEVYKSAVSSVHTVSDKEYNFSKAVNCMRWISIIQVCKLRVPALYTLPIVGGIILCKYM